MAYAGQVEPVPAGHIFTSMVASAFDTDLPAGTRRAVIRRMGAEIEMVDLPWGLHNDEGHPLRYLRPEGRRFPAHRCLLPATEFQVTSAGRRYRISLRDADWFYFAGIWRPATSHCEETFAILTVDANDDITKIQRRHGAVLRREHRMKWLDPTTPEVQLLRPLPAGSFLVEELAHPAKRQNSLPLRAGS